MGNSLGGKKRTKIMKINGETIKLKTPIQAGAVTKDYPGYVLLDSEAVKHFGIRAKPLGLCQELKPKRLYFLVELPKVAEERATRKVRSGINMSAKDRLESLKLARRSVSDLTLMQPKSSIGQDRPIEDMEKDQPVRLKMRLPKAEVQRLMSESKSEAEAAEKIMQLYLGSNKGDTAPDRDSLVERRVHWEEGGDGRVSQAGKARKKRVGFLPVEEIH
ncbi:Plastid movement impaired protein [Heracleum sosnowskyi]|uniref:Plastid movement impaired protein n=1 Tax=Heracleum sosnowskyi TaxID=360622 RepID=A0AAD8IRY6_9APIA|nr:Plastid movement impaired protein [Heracleum sosnowskyi]